MEAFAEFAGESVGFLDLLRIAEKARELSGVSHLERKEIRRSMRDERKRSLENYWGPRRAMCEAAEHLARQIDPTIRAWRTDPDRVAEALRGVERLRDLEGATRRVRDLADSLARLADAEVPS